MTIDEMLNTGYEFEHAGKHYRVKGVTQSIKGELSAWLKMRILTEARLSLPAAEYQQVRREILAAGVDPQTMLAALGSLDGTLFLLRKCLRDLSGNPVEVSDDTLLDMLGTEHVKTILELFAGETRDPKVIRSLLLGR